MSPYTEEYIKMLRFELRIFMVINAIAATIVIIGTVLILGVRSQLRGQAKQIQQQRYDSILNSCEDQNARRANTIATLNKQILKLKDGQRVRAEASENATIALINSLVPHQRCSELAKRSTTGH